MSDAVTEAGDVEVFAKICERIADGETLHAICQNSDMPSRRTVFRWLEARADLRHQYARAYEQQAHAFADGVVAEARNCTPKNFNAARVRIDALKWAAAKKLPKVYGDRTILSGDDDNPIAITDVTDAKADLLRRAAALAAGSGAPGVDSEPQ